MKCMTLISERFHEKMDVDAVMYVRHLYDLLDCRHSSVWCHFIYWDIFFLESVCHCTRGSICSLGSKTSCGNDISCAAPKNRCTPRSRFWRWQDCETSRAARTRSAWYRNQSLACALVQIHECATPKEKD